VLNTSAIGKPSTVTESIPFRALCAPFIVAAFQTTFFGTLRAGVVRSQEEARHASFADWTLRFRAITAVINPTDTAYVSVGECKKVSGVLA